jgi:hypothetical protein
MNFDFSLTKLYPKRNRPVRCKSRWRKTLDRRHRPHRIVEASRKNPFIKIVYRAKTEEELREIEQRNLLMMAGLGCVAGPAMFQPGRLEELLAAAGEER